MCVMKMLNWWKLAYTKSGNIYSFLKSFLEQVNFKYIPVSRK